MYSVRRFSVRHSRGMEWIYEGTRPAILASLRAVTRVFGHRLDGVITWIEARLKGLFFDCRMCGDCVLSSTGMSCPMNCPKTLRNGPCGGVRADGMCEVQPAMRCVWVDAWDGASRMVGGDRIHAVQVAVDHRNWGKSSWLALARDD